MTSLRCTVPTLTLVVVVLMMMMTIGASAQATDSASVYTATTAAPRPPFAVAPGDDEDDDSDALNAQRNDSTLDDFEDTVPDSPPEIPSTERLFAGLGKALDLIQTLSSVWMSLPEHANNPHRYAREANTEVSEGRYIKGDPLKGYYDFIITEGSYKFWAAFQLFTAGLMIYSTFAAIYYSKVNPIVADYDYVSYLGGARSLGSASAAARSADDGGAHPLESLLNAGWLQSAAHGFEFVLDAIDRLPASTA